MGTWNVRSLYRPGAFQSMVGEVERYGVEVVALQETRWAGEGSLNAGSYTLHYGGSEIHSLGIGFMINRKILSAVKDIKFINERLGLLVVQGRWYKIAIINVHAPTEDKDGEIKDGFYEELEHLVDQLPNDYMKIVVGDFNAKIGKEDIFRPTIGLESLHEESNDNGVRVINFATGKNLIVKSTYFKHKNIHKQTWISPDGGTRNQIDHVLADKRRHTNVLDVRSYRGADCDSDHLFVIAKIRERLSLNKTNGQLFGTKRLNVQGLIEGENGIKYAVEVTNRLAASKEIDESDDNTVDKHWENVRDAIVKSAEATVGFCKRNKNKPWFDEECVKIVKVRNEARITWLAQNTKETRDQFLKIRQEAHNMFKIKKRQYLKRKIEEIDENCKSSNVRGTYMGINNFRKGFQARTEMVKDENDNLVTDTTAVLNTWKNYFDRLLNVESENDREIENFEYHTAEPRINEPTISEVESAIKKLKNHKAPGNDLIPAELIKWGGSRLIEEIQKLIILIWNKEALPEQWKDSIIIPIFKKGDKMSCNNYRGISLLPTCYKILSNILLMRLVPYADEIIGDHQCGFRRNRSTADQIFTIRQILEKKWEFDQSVHQLYIDFKKAYDSIKREKMYEILTRWGIPKKLANLVQVCLKDTRGRVRIGNQMSETFNIHSGLKQGDALSPLLFNLVLEYAIKEMQKSNDGLQLNGTTQILTYADDIALLGDNKETLINNAKILLDKTKELGLQINVEKTKYMVTDRIQNIHNNGNLVVCDKIFERVSNFKYLGSILNQTNEIREELKRRINLGNACFYSVKKLLGSRILSRRLKIRIYRTIILPVVLYGSEAWSLTLQDEKRFRAFENKVLRKIIGAKRDEETGEWRKLHNAELHQLYNSPDIINVIKSRRLRWAGHAARMDENRIAYKVLIGKPDGKRPLGRPRRRWEENIRMDLNEMGYEGHKWRDLAQGREQWRDLVFAAMSFRVPNA